MNMSRRTLRAVAAAAVMVAVTAVPAAAHTTANPGEAAAGSYAKIDFRPGHGCEGEPTQELTVQIPDGVVSVKPEQVPGWDAGTEIGPYDEPVELHGQELTEGVREVTWTAQPGNELPDDRFREFGISMKLPDRAGDTLYFPAIQTCPSGAEEAWIEIPQDGDEDLDSPAPSVTLTAGGGSGHGASDGEAAGDTDEAAADGTDGQATQAAAASADADADTLTIVALIAGLLGLAAGVGALVTARRR